MVSCGIILGGYYGVWNFMAKKRVELIKQKLDSSSKFDFNYNDVTVGGYPNNIKVTVKDLSFDSKDAHNNISYDIGDVLFKIHPFVLQQQAEIILPSSHMLSFDDGGEVKKFKIQSSNLDLRFLDSTINFDVTDFKIFDVDANKLVLKADKIYYTGSMDTANNFRFNLKNLKFKDNTIDSVLIELGLERFNQLDIYAFILNMLILEGDELQAYIKENVEYLHESNSTIDLKNMKLVNEDIWFELTNKVKIDKRNRLYGPLEIVSNDIKVTEQILHTLTANEELKISELDIMKRLIAKNRDKLIRISGKLERGFLYIYNEKVTRSKPVAH